MLSIFFEELAEASLRDRKRGLTSAAEVVESEGHVAEPSESVRPLANVVVLSATLVHQQHAGPVTSTPLVIDCEVANQRNTKCFVLDP